MDGGGMMVEVEDCIVGSMEGFEDSIVDGVAVVLMPSVVVVVVDDEEDEGAGREMMYVQMSVLHVSLIEYTVLFSLCLLDCVRYFMLKDGTGCHVFDECFDSFQNLPK